MEDGRWRIHDPGLWIKDSDSRIEERIMRIVNQGFRIVIKGLRLRTEDQRLMILDTEKFLEFLYSTEKSALLRTFWGDQLSACGHFITFSSSVLRI